MATRLRQREVEVIVDLLTRAAMSGDDDIENSRAYAEGLTGKERDEELEHLGELVAEHDVVVSALDKMAARLLR